MKPGGMSVYYAAPERFDSFSNNAVIPLVEIKKDVWCYLL